MAQTYNSLVSIIQNYIKRTDDAAVTAVLPTWIENAQRRISLELKAVYNRMVATGTLTVGQNVFVKPVGWRQTITFLLLTPTAPGGDFTQTVELFPRQYGALNQVYPNRAALATPGFYADYDVNHYFLASSPDLAYPFELTYYANVDFITPENQTNYYTEFMPDLLLKACLVETPGYLKKPDMAQTWQQDYTSLLSAYNGEQKGRMIDQANLRTDGRAS